MKIFFIFVITLIILKDKVKSQDNTHETNENIFANKNTPNNDANVQTNNRNENGTYSGTKYKSCGQKKACVPFYECTAFLFYIQFNDNTPCERNYLEVCCPTNQAAIVKDDSSSFGSEVVLPTPQPNFKCGKRNSDGIAFKITGNQQHESEYGEFPWMIAVLRIEKIRNEAFNIFLCGGSLIHPQVVLTAAHCVAKHDTDDLVVRAGEWDTQSEEEIYKEQNGQVIEIVLHEDFNNKSLFNDIALLFTAKQFNLAPNINTVCLPPPDFNFKKNRCFSTGWGKGRYHGEYHAILKKIDVPVVPNDECQTKLQTTPLDKIFKLHESFICAGGEGQNTCKGDDGGPLSCPIPELKDRFYQAGVVAVELCETFGSSPDVYTSIAFFRNWIDQKMAERYFDKTYYTP